MTRVIVKPEVAASLGGLAFATEFCDADGKVLGYFQPITPPSLKYVDLGISEEEIRRREQVRTGRPIDDVLAEWENR